MHIIFIALIAFSYNTQVPLDLVRIDITQQDQITELDHMGVIINQVHEDHIVGEIDPRMYSEIESRGYRITLVQTNIADVYIKNSRSTSERAVYLTYEQIRDSMIVLANTYSFFHLETLGVSHQGRLLLAMRISDNADVDEDEPPLHLEGNIHGDEKIAWGVNFCMLSYLASHYATDTLVQRLVDTREIWIAPLVNPDGYYNNSRYNGRGVDVNRNWGWMWGNEYNCGSDFMSENEARAFLAHFWRHPFVIYASYHAGTKCISEPWSYTSYIAPPEQNLIRHLSQGYAAYTGYPYGQGSIVMYPINGATKDYDYGCGGEMGWSIEVCYTKTPPAESIDVIFNRDRPAMMYFMDKAGQGIHGTITDSLTSDPLYALIYVGSGNGQSYSCPMNGDFHRFYLPGTYNVTVMAPGYEPRTISNVTVPSSGDSSVYIDVKLMPNTSLPVYVTRVIGSQYVTTSSNLTYPTKAIGPHDSDAYRLDTNKWIVLAFDFPIRNGAGNDFTVFRSSGTGSAAVYVGNSWYGSWQSVGTANSAMTEFDIASTGLDSVMYVRLVASSQFMLDAIEAVQVIPGTEEHSVRSLTALFEVYPTVTRSSVALAVFNSHAHALPVVFYNVVGQEVSRAIIPVGRSALDVSSLSAGIYYLQNKDQGISQRIIIVK
ncbi:T9SS type A sorting domain-containing protein [candidate division WOR-3 bacterium]|nr:T9SS type A sorting domain-containing protein [candidate division WOR-3 bacterium]